MTDASEEFLVAYKTSLEKPKDVINPDYYKFANGQVIDITKELSFCLGSAIKYCARAGKKGDAVEDLKKAMWYIQTEIERLSKK